MVLVSYATPSEKVRICHATSSESNPYTNNNVNTSSVDEANNRYLNGHGDHSRDIIPPFESPEGTVFVGKNWTSAGRAIWENGCKVVTPEPSPSQSTTDPEPTPTNPSPSGTPTPTVTPTVTPSASGSPSPRRTTPTPDPSTPVASQTPTGRSTPTTTQTPTATTPAKPKSPSLPKCSDVAKEQAGKTYAKDSPEANGIACVG